MCRLGLVQVVSEARLCNHVLAGGTSIGSDQMALLGFVLYVLLKIDLGRCPLGIEFL